MQENEGEEVARIIVGNLVDDHGLYFGMPQHAKCRDIGLNHLKDIQIVHVLFVNFVVIPVVLASDQMADTASWRFSSNSVPEVVWWSVVVGPELWILVVTYVCLLFSAVCAVLSDVGLEERRKHCRLTDPVTRAGF